MACYSNLNIPEKFQYSEETDFYLPYESEKIVDLALEGMGFTGDDSA